MGMRRCPFTLQQIVPPRLIKIEQSKEIFLGICPTVLTSPSIIFPYSHCVGVMCVTDLTLANKCIIFRRTFPDAFILMVSTDHRFYLETVNHASRYTLHSTAPRQLQSRGQVHNKRNNQIVGFVPKFFCQ